MTPRWVKAIVPTAWKERFARSAEPPAPPLPSYDYLRGQMERYRVENLVGVDPRLFRRKVEGFLELSDHEMEGYRSSEKQRDFSIKFRWGHDHDFGDFALDGQMKDRHITLLATFMDWFGALPRCLDGLKVLDIGCWTGGTSLLLCAMGAEVVAIEEVKKYVECLEYLKDAFGVERLQARHLSLYECTGAEFQDAFDYVLFAGVLYHVTDPILAMRLSFNCLKDGGRCLLETAVMNSNERVLAYLGPTMFAGGSAEEMNRTGWNWFFPTPLTLRQMMADVGYSDIQVQMAPQGRAFAVARRQTHVDMLRAGLSMKATR